MNFLSFQGRYAEVVAIRFRLTEVEAQKFVLGKSQIIRCIVRQ